MRPRHAGRRRLSGRMVRCSARRTWRRGPRSRRATRTAPPPRRRGCRRASQRAADSARRAPPPAAPTRCPPWCAETAAATWRRGACGYLTDGMPDLAVRTMARRVRVLLLHPPCREPAMTLIPVAPRMLRRRALSADASSRRRSFLAFCDVLLFVFAFPCLSPSSGLPACGRVLLWPRSHLGRDACSARSARGVACLRMCRTTDEYLSLLWMTRVCVHPVWCGAC